MKLLCKTSSEFVIADKPADFLAFSPKHDATGLREIFEHELNVKLYPVNNLDTEATGQLIFAKSPEAAARLAPLFDSEQIERKYLFLTDRKSKVTELISRISINGKKAETRFQRLKRSPFFELWEARSQTDHSQQIRIHAKEIGLPILGDTKFGGTAFPHLCLHAEELKIPDWDLLTSTPPLFFSRLGLLKDPILIQWLSHLDRRQRLYGFLQQPDESIRLIHTPEFRADLYGSQIWFYWYHDTDPCLKDLNRCEFVAQILKKQWLLRKMQNRGDDPNARQIWTSDEWKTVWKAKENNIYFEFHSDLGQSPGLFLDQRQNRLKIRQISKNKSLLNLFAYTCGFSVNAAFGQAAEVCSVDLSQTFLKWGQDNFNLNQIDPSQYEFFQQESLLFLNGTLKRNRKFDLIVCDPPSFGRHKGGVFRLEQALPELIQLCLKCLAPGGKILFSCNFEKWDREELKRQVHKVLKNEKGLKLEFEAPGLDYELPNGETLLKSLWINKST